MLTGETPAVDAAPHNRGETGGARVDGHWLSVTALAAERGVSKQVVSKNLARWKDAGAPVSTRRQGGRLLVNVAEYDRAKGDGDQVRDQEPAKAPAAVPADGTLAREQARRAGYDADLKRIELGERLGKLVPVEDVQRAAVACAEAMARIFDQAPSRAEENAAAVQKAGVAGARAFLRDMNRQMRARCVEELAKLPSLVMADDAETMDS